jgi:hypothetical protein
MFKFTSIALAAALGVAGIAQSAPAEAHPYVGVGIGFPGYQGPYFYEHGRYWHRGYDRYRYDHFRRDHWDRR